MILVASQRPNVSCGLESRMHGKATMQILITEVHTQSTIAINQSNDILLALWRCLLNVTMSRIWITHEFLFLFFFYRLLLFVTSSPPSTGKSALSIWTQYNHHSSSILRAGKTLAINDNYAACCSTLLFLLWTKLTHFKYHTLLIIKNKPYDT